MLFLAKYTVLNLLHNTPYHNYPAVKQHAKVLHDMLLVTLAAAVHLITNKLLVNLEHLDLYLFFFFFSFFHSSSISAAVTGTIVCFSKFFTLHHLLGWGGKQHRTFSSWEGRKNVESLTGKICIPAATRSKLYWLWNLTVPLS